MSSGGLWLLDAVVILAGAAAAAYGALQLGLARTAAATLAGLCLAVGIVASLIAGSAGALGSAGAVRAAGAARTAGAAAPPPHIAIDAARFARLRASAIPGRGHVDAVAGRSVVRYDEPRRLILAGTSGDVVLRGWAVVGAVNLPGSAVFALVDGEFAARATYGLDRPDVAEALGNAACAPSGFTLTLHGPAYGAGEHRVVVGIVTPDGTGYETLGAPMTLVLRGPAGP
jgi:hypothetical protein